MKNLEPKIFEIGKKIFDLSEEDTGSIFNKDWWYGRIMDWSMKNEKFKTQMFRFVDVMPYLHSSDDVARHLKEYFSGPGSEGQEMPSVLGWGLGLGSLAPGLMASAIRKNVTQMAKMFITGTSGEEAIKNLEKMRAQNLCFTVDILGEAAVSESEALEYQNKYLTLIDELAARAARWPEIELIDRDESGPISKVNVSVKVSSLFSQLDAIDTEGSIAAVSERLRPILRRAREKNVFINLDMESYAHKTLTLKIFKSIMSEPEFLDYYNVGLVIQAYLRDSENDLRDLIAWARKRKSPSPKNGADRITVRLVKGAYWDYETVIAQQKDWPVPVFTNKNETDASYERLSRILLENVDVLKSAFGSHNVRSISHVLALAEELGIDKRNFEIQMLFGMAESIKKALAKMGLRVREYAPVGELIPGMAYLVRRLLENTSNESFLRAKFSSHVSIEELLKNPATKVFEKSESSPPATPSGVLEQNTKISQSIFSNEPPIDFTFEENRKAMVEALAKVKKNFGKKYSLVIGKKEISTEQELISINPSSPSVVVGKVSCATQKEADLAVLNADEAFPDWANTSPHKRAEIIDRAAALMSQRKFELAAVEVFEVGKTWREADGDVAEAIDFCRYYAQHMKKLAKPQRVSFVTGEDSTYFYQPRGTGVVIAPWNFPLAILTGMVVAAVVAGNTVVMKPSEQSSVIAAHLMQILLEAGLPPGVVQFLPGRGEEIGDYLVRHPKIDFVAFTGSKEVGLQILAHSAALTAPPSGVGSGAGAPSILRAKSPKKVIAEMGGKNAIIVDSDADLDEAVLGILNSAFGFQGQKCSACSRLIVLEEIYDKLMSRLIDAAKSLRQGDPSDPKNYLGPVVDEEAYLRILKMIEVGKSEATLAFQGEPIDKSFASTNQNNLSDKDLNNVAQGYFIPPTIFTNVKPNAQIAQKEIFGPVLGVIKVKNFDEAVAVANSTEFALTGGLYSRSPANIEKARREFEVGNLYINRGITGALVGRHPFGGFKMSGVGSKTGGPDYLQQFMEPRVITENTMRRGFSPELEAETQWT